MQKAEEIKTRWYYDACVLDKGLYEDIIRETTKPKKPIMAVLSHLALGEALGNIFAKGGNEQANQFIAFLDSLRRSKRLDIVGNDKIDDIFGEVCGCFGRANHTDPTHVCTAIVCGCSNFISADSDVTGIEQGKKRKIKKIAKEKYNVDDFCITRRPLKAA